MDICYVLDRPELCGGVKVVFQHAQLLTAQGHGVTILGLGRRPRWIDFSGRYHDYRRRPPRLKDQDLVIGTYFTTISTALELGLGPVAHFCQGYEADSSHLEPVRDKIEAVYRQDLPTFTVTPFLAQRLGRKFGRRAFVVPPPVDDVFRPTDRRSPEARPWIMIHGIFESELKNVATALEAVLLLRQRGLDCRVVRISILPLSPQEKAILKPDRYLKSVSPTKVARRLRDCDLLLFPSLPAEGFGLPLVEAMASRIPAVSSRIPSTEYIAGRAVNLVTPHDPAAFAEAAQALLTSPELWRRAQEKGYQAVQRFLPGQVGARLEEGLKWAAKEVSGGGA